jgi:hypothetical protein
MPCGAKGPSLVEPPALSLPQRNTRASRKHRCGKNTPQVPQGSSVTSTFSYNTPPLRVRRPSVPPASLSPAAATLGSSPGRSVSIDKLHTARVHAVPIIGGVNVCQWSYLRGGGGTHTHAHTHTHKTAAVLAAVAVLAAMAVVVVPVVWRGVVWRGSGRKLKTARQVLVIQFALVRCVCVCPLLVSERGSTGE